MRRSLDLLIAPFLRLCGLLVHSRLHSLVALLIMQANGGERPQRMKLLMLMQRTFTFASNFLR
jgi:hypothetical protein